MTKREFLENLYNEITKIESKYKRNIETDEIKYEIFSEYCEPLLEKFLKNISSTQCNITDCFDSIQALASLCDKRISLKMLKPENTTPDLEKSTDALKYMVRTLSASAVILDITGILRQLFLKSLDVDSCYSCKKPVISENEALQEIQKLENEMIEYIENGYVKREVLLLERIMEEKFPEFDDIRE